MDWQLAAVWAVLAVSVLMLFRRAIRLWLPPRRGASGCQSCSGCSTRLGSPDADSVNSGKPSAGRCGDSTPAGTLVQLGRTERVTR